MAEDFVEVGAGIIGVTCALQLARQGRRVVVLDGQEPGMGASYGNAGHLATAQVFPIAGLSILQRLPAMLMDPMGPLRLDWKYLPRAPVLVCPAVADPATHPSSENRGRHSCIEGAQPGRLAAFAGQHRSAWAVARGWLAAGV